MAPLTQSIALDRPPSNILTKIFAFAIPVQKLVIKDLNRDKWPKKPFEKVLLRNFSNHAREIDAALYSRLTFNFMSVTPRSGEILDGCDVAKAFFGAMRPRQRWLIRDIHCDLNWHKKGRAEDTVFPVLAKLMNHPVNHITFEVIPAPDANHLPRGIKSKTFGFHLTGLVGVKIVIFVVNLARPPAAEPFAERMSRWIGRDYRIARLDFFALPLEMRNVVYKNFLPKQHLHQ